MRFSRNSSPLAREFAQLLLNHRLATWGILFMALGLILLIPAKAPVSYQNTSNSQALGSIKSLQGGSIAARGSDAQGISTNQPNGSGGNQPASSVTSGSNSNMGQNQDNLRYPLPISPLLHLNVSPATVDVTKGSVTVTISAADGSPITAPTAKTGDGLIANVEWQNPPADFPGGQYRLKSWTATISRIDYSSSSDTYVTFTNPGGESGSVHVIWSPAPEFTMTAGAVTRTSEDNTTISYTTHFSIQPNNPYFGSPRLTMRIINTPQCINSASLSKEVTYNGTNDYSLDCTVQKGPTWQPGNGSAPPPTAGPLNITVEAFGTLPDGSFIKGPGNIYFNTPAPYNQ